MKIKYTEISFLHIKASESWSIEWVVKTAAPLKVSNQRYPLQPEQTQNLQCCKSGSGIQDQGSGAFLIPRFGIWDPGLGSGIGKKSGSRSGIRIRDRKLGSYFCELRNHFFGLKYLNSWIHIRDPGSGMEKVQIQDQGSRMQKILIQDPGSGMEKIQIRDPGSGIDIPDQQIWKFHRQIC